VGPYNNYIPRTIPNNYGRREHCLHYWHNKKWNDFNCDAKQRFICEAIRYNPDEIPPAETNLLTN
jgi:hypothetical protein